MDNIEIKKKIDWTECQRRETAVRYAHASVRFEGGIIDKEEEKHAQRYINGELTLEEFVNE